MSLGQKMFLVLEKEALCVPARDNIQGNDNDNDDNNNDNNNNNSNDDDDKYMMMIKVVGEDQVKILPKSPMGERSLVPQVPSDKY